MTMDASFRYSPLAGLLLALGAAPLATQADEAPGGANTLDTVIVTARLRPEPAESVPIALSVVDRDALTETGTVNVSALTQLVPSLNYSSPNPRNTSYTIRGLGSSVVAIAQSNDGLEPGVGFYVDGVYHGRPATAAFDFADLDHVEVLRGPQGTLFGKNTTAGAISITTRPPEFQRSTEVAISAGDYGALMTQGYVTGALYGDRVAGRVSFASSDRRGTIYNVVTGVHENDIGNLALRAQLLVLASERFRVRLISDFSAFDSTCCTQVYVGVGTTLKTADRQYPALAAGMNYAPPSLDPYDRLTDIDAALKVHTNEGGLAALADWALEGQTLSSITSWRFWNWDAANDRDYTGLQVQTLQHIPSRQDQYSQEFRLASTGARRVDYVAGLYTFAQTLLGEPITQYGAVATWWLLGPPSKYPANLLDGYGSDGHTRFHSMSSAAYGELTWHATSRWSVTGGVRYTRENKEGRYASNVYGGLQTTNAAWLKGQLSILRPQAYSASVSDGSPTGRLNVAYAIAPNQMAYASLASGAKSGGINMSGLPLDASNQPALGTAVIRPEHNTTAELGLKGRFLDQHLEVNADLYQTTVRDFQTNVVDTGPGALRGYLANIERVRVNGAELDATARLDARWSAHLSYAYTDGKYVSYKNGPCPLELIGASTTVCDLSGRPLTATPRHVGSAGLEYTAPLHPGAAGALYVRTELARRSSMYGDASDSRYTLIGGYSLLNATLGLRTAEHWDLSVWSHNLLNRNYLSNVTIQAGNSGLVVGLPGDPRTYGVTVRGHF